jgi:hypothetical protein
LEPYHRLYLYGGSSYILVPESHWLNEVKSDPAGHNVVKSVEDAIIAKGWIKIKETRDPNSNFAVTTEWLYTETGAKLKTVVDKDGQLKVDGQPIGPSVVADTYKRVAKMAEDARLIKGWVQPAPAAIEAQAQKPTLKGGPHPTSNILASQPVTANMQLIGKYEPLLTKENPTPQERLTRINRLIEMAEKEENALERDRLLSAVDSELNQAEAVITGS